MRACEDIQEVGVLDIGMRGEHTQIIVGGDGDPDHAGCTWCGECVRVCPTGAIFEFIPKQRFGSDAVRAPDKVVRSVCPYCGVGCQIDLHVKGDQIMRVTSPSIEETTPNQGSTCVKGRFGYDFPMHRDRLMTPLIRKGWMHDGERWVWTGEWPRHREGPWLTIEEMGEQKNPRPPLRPPPRMIQLRSRHRHRVLPASRHSLHSRHRTPLRVPLRERMQTPRRLAGPIMDGSPTPYGAAWRR